LRILFWGTPEFAVASLRALDDEGFEVVAVVTQPDRPAGRGRQLKPSPVKHAALDLGIEVLAPDRPRGEEFLDRLRALEPDLSVVVAYGHILRPEVLDVPRMGSINVHASILPELRGAAPINWAIARGHAETGVSIMRMVEEMDAGPVIHVVREPILADETASELTLRLAELGAEALVEALAILSAGSAVEVEQDHAAATFAPKVDREAARVDWARSPVEVARHIRAMDAVPGAWSYLKRAPVKLFRPTALEDEVPVASPRPRGNGGPPPGEGAPPPGTVVRADADEGLIVAVDGGSVRIGEVQPPGKRRMSAIDWIHGRGVEPGQRFA